MKRLAVGLVVIAASSMMSPIPFATASCTPFGNLREEIDDADAAIVGTVVDGPGSPSSMLRARSRSPLRYTVEVERDVKDNVGREFTFTSGTAGSFVSSQFEGRVGERVGLLLDRRQGRFAVSDCSKRDPQDILAAAQPLPPPRGRGLPRLLAAGAFGAPRVVLFDERGLSTHIGDGEHDARVDVCPTERFIAEVVSDGSDFSEEGSRAAVEVRDLASMRVVRRSALPRSITSRIWTRPFAIACRDENARDVLVASEAGEYTARVVRLLADRWVTAYHDKARAVTFVHDGFAVIKHGGDRFELVVHSDGGEVRSRLGRLPSFKSLAISEPIRLTVDPSGRYVAGANEEPLDRGGDNLFVADLRTDQVARARVGWVAGLAWAGTDLVVAPIVQPDEGGYVDPAKGGEVRVYDADLDLKHSWARWSGMNPVIIGERLYGVRASRRERDGSPGISAIVSAPYRSGPERVENEIGDLDVNQLVTLSAERVAAERLRPRFTWAAAGLVVLIVAFAAIAIRSRFANDR